MHNRPIALAALALLMILSIAGADAARDCNSHPISGATMKPGFCVFEYLSLPGARGIDLAPNGDLLVLSRDGTPTIRLVYESASGEAQTMTIATQSGLNHAVKFKDGYVYASTDATVYRWKFNGRRPMSDQETVITAIPGGGHATRTIEFGQVDDWMYISVGSSSNIDTDSQRARVKRMRLNNNTVLPVDWNDAQVEVFADGLRNEVGLRIDPFNRLWGVENGIDNLDRFDTTPPIYITNPAEEVNIFTQESAGMHYGYPWCWSEGIGEYADMLSFPGGLGNGTIWAQDASVTQNDEWCRANTLPCAWAMQAHAAPLDIFFDEIGELSSSAVAIVPHHGSWNRPDDFRAGFRVIYLELDRQWAPQSSHLLVQFPQDYSTRPVAGVRGPCASYGSCLFFTDDGAGKLFVVAKESNITPFATPGGNTSPSPELTPSQGTTIEVNDELTLSWSIIDNVLTTTIVHTDATGWFSAGWNGENIMTGAAVLSLDGTTTGVVEVSGRDEGAIMASWNTSSSNWGYYDIEARIENGNQMLTFKRPVTCPDDADQNCFDIPTDGTGLSHFIFAFNAQAIGYFDNSTLPRHSGTARHSIALYDTTPPPSSSAPRTSWSPVVASVVLVLLGIVLR